MPVAHEPLQALVIRAYDDARSHEDVPPELKAGIDTIALHVPDGKCLLRVSELVRPKCQWPVRLRVLLVLALREYESYPVGDRRIRVQIERLAIIWSGQRCGVRKLPDKRGEARAHAQRLCVCEVGALLLEVVKRREQDMTVRYVLSVHADHAREPSDCGRLLDELFHCHVEQGARFLRVGSIALGAREEPQVRHLRLPDVNLVASDCEPGLNEPAEHLCDVLHVSTHVAAGRHDDIVAVCEYQACRQPAECAVDESHEAARARS